MLAWLVALMPVLLIAGIWLGGHPGSLPTFLRDAFVADHDTRVVNEAIDDVSHDYYRPIPRSTLGDASVAGIVASLGDRFSNYLSPGEFRNFDKAGSFSGVGISIQPEHRGLLITEIFDNSPASRAGLAVGDLIVAVNGQSLVGLASATSTQLIKGRPGTDVKLTYRRRGHATSVTVTRALISEPVVASAMRTVAGRKLGVVALSMFSAGAHGDVRAAVDRELHQGARGLLLDLRDNGGGLVEEARLVASIFIPQGVIVTTRGRSQPTMTLSAAGDAISSSIPVVVLVNSRTASAAEIVTGALQDHGRATVVGTHTFGKGVFQEVRPLSNGGALDITVGEYFTPNGRNLGGGGVSQGAGITPDVTVSARKIDGAKGLQAGLATLAARTK
jgi:carboxyl-terminal processing protease